MSNSIVDLVNQQRNNVPNSQLPQSNLQMQQLKGLIQQLKNGQNPQTLLQNIVSQNPNVKNILNVIRMTNSTPEQFARVLAQQKGVDIDALIQELQN